MWDETRQKKLKKWKSNVITTYGDNNTDDDDDKNYNNNNDNDNDMKIQP